MTGAGTTNVTASYGALSGSTTLRGNRQSQTISFAPLPPRTFTDPPFNVTATASSGLPVSFTAAGNCSIAGVTVTLTGAGSCTVTASQSGDSTYAAAADVPQTFAIAKAPATLTLSGALVQTYNGAPHVLTATTSAPAPATVTITYNGSTTAPTNAGTYAVVATLTSANYQATNATATLTVNQGTTTTTVISSGTPSFVGNLVTFTARVTATGGGTPTGTVSFRDGGVEFPPPNRGRKTVGPCPAPSLPNTSCAQYTISTLTKGKHTITAVYLGDPNLTGSTSPSIVQQMK
jgi:hypothetical protein